MMIRTFSPGSCSDPSQRPTSLPAGPAVFGPGGSAAAAADPIAPRHNATRIDRMLRLPGRRLPPRALSRISRDDNSRPGYPRDPLAAAPRPFVASHGREPNGLTQMSTELQFRCTPAHQRSELPLSHLITSGLRFDPELRMLA